MARTNTFCLLLINVSSAAAPITALVQAGLLGTYVGTDALGAFGAVSITAGFATRVFNFLVDGVSAKTGKSVGLRAWNELGMRVRMSLGFASCAGALASVTLAAIMRPVSVDVLRLSPEVQAEAEGYWWLRVVLVPVLLINMSISGILQGFRHVRTAALLNTGQALLEMVGSTLVLRHNWNIGPFDGLFAMGLVTLVTQTTALITGLICILSMPPPEAAGHFSLWKSLFRREETLNDQSMSLEEPLYGEHMGLLSSAGKSRLIGTASKTKWIGDPRLQDMTESLDSMASTVFPEAASASDELYITIALDGTRQSRKVENGRNDLSTETCHGTSPDEQLDETTTSRVEREIFVQEALPHEQESLLDFVKDGLNMFLRSMILQITFFSTLVAASRLGTAR